MELEQFYIMRHELLLTIAALLFVIAEIVTPSNKRDRLPGFAVGLFALITIIGFIPSEHGVLFGGMYISNPMNTLVKNILNIGVFIVALQSVGWLSSHPSNKERITEYFMLIISTLMGMNFMISAGDFLMFFLGLELATIPMAALVAYDLWKNESAEAGVKMALSAALSTGVSLFGVSIIYGTTGSIYFSEIAQNFSGDTLSLIGFIFFFSGLAFKISLVPFHFWTADVYQGAPIGVTSYLSVISKGAAAFALMIVLFTVFRHITNVWQDILYVVSVSTMTIGNLFALRQQNLKRFLAFSSIAQAGFILLGIISGSSYGSTSVIYFTLIYIFSNLAAFGVISVISNATGKENMDDYNGLYLTNPKLSLVMTLALFSLAGIPPVAGFFGKFFLFTSAASEGYYWLVLIAVLNATISLYYYLLVVKAMFINKNENPIAKIKSSFYDKIAMTICVIGILFIGFYGDFYDYIDSISQKLFSAWP